MTRRLLCLVVAAVVVGRAGAAWAYAAYPSCLPTAAGTVHYVCDCGSGTVNSIAGGTMTVSAASGCVAGNDSNAGTAASPWKTWEKVRTTFNAAGSGDQILICRGAVLDASAAGNSWVNGSVGNPSKGTAAPSEAQRLTVGSYVAPWNTGGEARPYVINSPGIDTQNGGAASEEQGYVFTDLILDAGTNSTGTAGQGFNFYNDVDYVLLCDLDVGGFNLGVQLGDDNGTCNAGADGHCSNIEGHYNNFFNLPGQGWLGADDNTLISHSTYTNCGSARATLNHGIYLGASQVCGAQGTYSNATIEYTTITQTSMSAGQCSAAEVVFHSYLFDQITYQYNRVFELPGVATGGCEGLTINAGDGFFEEFTNVLMRSNRLENNGNEPMGCGSCKHVVIENNVIVNGQGNGPTGVTVPDKGPELPNDSDSDDITVRNNSIYTDGGVCVEISEGATRNVYNNACYITGSGTVSGFNLPTSGWTTGGENNNMFYAPNAGTAHWESSTGDGLAAWRTATGYAAQSVYGTTPGYKTLSFFGAYDLSASSGSSAIVDAGSTANGASIDFNGVTRPQGGATDIGAYEFVVSGTTKAPGLFFLRGNF